MYVLRTREAASGLRPERSGLAVEVGVLVFVQFNYRPTSSLLSIFELLDGRKVLSGVNKGGGGSGGCRESRAAREGEGEGVHGGRGGEEKREGRGRGRCKAGGGGGINM